MNRINICFIMLFLIFLPLIFPSAHQTSFKYQIKTKSHNFELLYSSNEENLTGFYDRILQFSDLLINLANTTEGGWSWKRYLNLPDDPGNSLFSQYHPGYFYGVAGIGDTFLRIYNLTKNTSYLSVAEYAANYIFTHGVIDFESFRNNYIHWTRASDSVTIYTGMKYGYAGISKFLLNLFEQTKNTTYLNIATKSLDALIYYSKNSLLGDLYWGYNIWTNSGLTGYTYGTSGISEIFLDAYKVTNNKTYLDIAVESVNWILNLTQILGYGDQQQLIITASSAAGWENNISGLYTGAAGVGNFFLRLFETTNNEIYLEYSKGISRWLISVMDEGYWQYGAVDFLTEIEIEQGYFNGLAAGSAGIGIFFINLFKHTNESTFLYPVNKIYEALSENAAQEGNTTFWMAQKKGYWSNKVYTGIGFGLAGIGKFYSAIYNNFGDFENTTKSFLIGIDNYFKIKRDATTGLIPYVIPAENGIIYYRSDYFDGLAGIIDFYLDALFALNTTQPIYLPEILETATTVSLSKLSFTTTTQTTTNLNEPVTNNILFSEPLSLTLMSIAIILTILKRKRRNI